MAVIRPTVQGRREAEAAALGPGAWRYSGRSGPYRRVCVWNCKSKTLHAPAAAVRLDQTCRARAAYPLALLYPRNKLACSIAPQAADGRTGRPSEKTLSALRSLAQRRVVYASEKGFGVISKRTGNETNRPRRLMVNSPVSSATSPPPLRHRLTNPTSHHQHHTSTITTQVPGPQHCTFAQTA